MKQTQHPWTQYPNAEWVCLRLPSPLTCTGQPRWAARPRCHAQWRWDLLRSRGGDVVKWVRRQSRGRSTSAAQSQLPDRPTAATLSLPLIVGRQDPRQDFIFTTALCCRSSSDLFCNGLLHDSELTIRVVICTLRPLGCVPSIHLTVPAESDRGHRVLLSQSHC